MNSTTNKPIQLVIMGVAGSGKTTIAKALQAELGWDYAEADDFHPQKNIDKMASGVPLDDDDRRPWLESLRAWMDKQDSQNKSSVITCSALKKSYRDILRGDNDNVVFVHLDGSAHLLAQRLRTRQGHFMPPALLQSQFETLEPLESGERGVKLSIVPTPDKITQSIIEHLESSDKGTKKPEDI